jgi:hypothetical protein
VVEAKPATTGQAGSINRAPAGAPDRANFDAVKLTRGPAPLPGRDKIANYTGGSDFASTTGYVPTRFQRVFRAKVWVMTSLLLKGLPKRRELAALHTARNFNMRQNQSSFKIASTTLYSPPAAAPGA